MKNKILKLKAKYSLYAGSITLLMTSLFAIYNLLNNKYHFMDIFKFKESFNIFGHKITLPATRDNLFSAYMVSLLIFISWFACCQIYYKYKYERDKIKNPNIEPRSISLKKLLSCFALILLCSTIFFFCDEIILMMETAMKGKIDLFAALAFGIILAVTSINVLVDIKEKKLLPMFDLVSKKQTAAAEITNKKENKEKDLSFFQKYKLVILKSLLIAGTAVAMLTSAYLITLIGKNLPKMTELEVSFKIGEDTIKLFSNHENVMLLTFAECAIFLVMFNIFNWLEKKYRKDEQNTNKNKEENKNSSKISSVLKTFGYVCATTMVANISMNITNSIGNLNSEAGGYAFCTAALVLVAMYFAAYTIFNFSEKEKVSEKLSSSIISANKSNELEQSV